MSGAHPAQRLASGSPLRAALVAALVATTDTAPHAAALLDDATDVETYELPLLRAHTICRVVEQNWDHDEAWFVGFRPGGEVYLLTMQPDQFVALAQADGVHITTEDDARAYARAFVETTADTSTLFYVVASVDDLQFFPSPDSDEAAAIEDIRRRYATRIGPPSVAATPAGYDVSLWVMRQQALERHRLEITPEGHVEHSIDVVEARLPTVYSA